MQIAKSIGLSELKDEREIIFTSGGTESINWVLHSHSHNTGPSHFITTGLEHCAVNNYIKNISSEQFSYSIVNPTRNTFHINPDDIIAEVKENTRLICVMLGLASKTQAEILSSSLTPQEQSSERILPGTIVP